VVVILGLLLGHLNDSPKKSTSNSAPLPAVTVAAPPADAAAEAPCTKVLEGLPIQLDGLDPRQVVSTPSSPFVVGWGNPAVILRCGVAKPRDVHPGSTAQFVLISAASGAAGVYFDVTKNGPANVYTSVDRAVYVEITEPASDNGAQMPALAAVIAAALPPVCDGDGSDPEPTKLCAARP
jgi:Protein of unknown function (DUF3515)